MYYLSEGHALNLLDVIHPKRGDLMVNERTVSQKHQNYIIYIQVNLPSQQYFVFWCLLNLQSKRVSFSFFLDFLNVSRKNSSKTQQKTQNFIKSCWNFVDFVHNDRVSSPGAISFHISLYVRNCSKHGTVFRSVFMFSGLCILPINCNF